MKIGVITDCFKLSLEESLKTAAELGFDGVQIYATIGDFSPEMSKEKRLEIKNLLSSLGLEVSALCGDMGGYGFEKAEDNPERVAAKELGIPTIVSLNPIMVDGTGMCGACRVTVGDKVKFACVDGPEFDGHLVNFDEAMKRQQIYKTAEGRAMLKLKEGDTHHGGCGQCGGDE